MVQASVLYLPAVLVAFGVIVYGVRRGYGALPIAIRLAAMAHCVAVVSVTFFPFPVQAEVIEEGRLQMLASNNFVPLVTMVEDIRTGRYPSVLHQSLGNFVMLLPLGIYAPMLWPRLRVWHRVLALGVGVSLAIETFQLAISTVLGYTYKIADIDDVILNSAGVMAGYAAYRVLAIRRSAQAG